eukprot:12398106-Ditylum_brightwellii.AAC.1
MGLLDVLEVGSDLFSAVGHMVAKDPAVQLDMGRKEKQVVHFFPLWDVGNNRDLLLPVVVGLWNPVKCHMCLSLGHVTQTNVMADIVKPEIKIVVGDSWNEQDIKAKGEGHEFFSQQQQ